MSEYASKTTIPVSQSMNQIQEILHKHNITKFMFDLESNTIYFQLNDKPVKISVPLPKLESFRETPTKQRRNDTQTKQLYEQDIKARWRLMKEYLKLQLELVRLEVLSIEQAFFPNFVLLNGKTLSEEWIPKITKENTVDILRLPEPKRDDTQDE